MHRVAPLFLLALFSVGASAATTWTGTSNEAIVRGSGGILAEDGAKVALSAESTGASGFVGAITSLNAGPFQGKEVRLSGTLRVIHGAGAAALWVRADGPEGKLAFDSSGRNPVRVGDGSRDREIWLYVPPNATSLNFGVTLDSIGRVDVDHLMLVTESSTSAAVSAYDVVAYALAVIRSNALNASNLDWPAKESALLTPDLKALPAQAAYSRIRDILKALGDHHSFLQTPRVASAYGESAVPTRAIEARSMEDIGYLLVPGLRGTDARASAAFTAALCEQVAKLASSSSNGFVLDLREDTGGNMWPMLNGLHSLLGQGDAGAFRDRDGITTHWSSRASAECSEDYSRRRVAVLVGPKTASSGEAIAVAFKARPGTRLFGQPTMGLSTSNRNFELPDGGALRLTTAVMLDRSGTPYPRGISPDTLVPMDQDAIQAAVAWLRSRP